MAQAAQALTQTPSEVVRNSPVTQAPNGICFAYSGLITVAANDLERLVAKHMQRHSNDAEKSLQALSAGSSARKLLQQIQEKIEDKLTQP